MQGLQIEAALLHEKKDRHEEDGLSSKSRLVEEVRKQRIKKYFRRDCIHSDCFIGNLRGGVNQGRDKSFIRGPPILFGFVGTEMLDGLMDELEGVF